MTMIYSNPARENENDGALPDVEVFEHDHGNAPRLSSNCSAFFGVNACRGVGWYWQRGTTGKTPDFGYSTWTPDPDGEPVGPFDTEAEAIADAQADALDDDNDSHIAMDDELPPCVLAMRCYCAGHARGNPASEPCDTNEEA